MTAVEDFARHLQRLRAEAGQPSVRQLAGRTGYSKTTVGDAFAGRRLPTWPLVERLSVALGVDADELRQGWAAIKGGSEKAQPVPDWLTCVRSGIPDLVSGMPFEEACAAAAKDPERCLASAWEVVRVSALQLSLTLYDGVPGSWSSNIVETYARAESDGHLPAGVRAVAWGIHYHHVNSHMHPPVLPTTAELLQLVVLAYRLAWQTRDVVTGHAGS